MTKKGKPVYAGLSISQDALELAVFSPKSFSIERSASFPTPAGIFDAEGDRVVNPQLLKEALTQLVKQIGAPVKAIHLSLPGTLLRLVEMPKISSQELYVSLSSEAERYKAFDDTEAIVDFAPIPGGNLPPNMQQVVFGAVRSDTLNTYRRILKELKLKIASITLEPLNTLRAMAGTGVLDALVQQIGANGYWGTIFVESSRVRISLWQGNSLVELRETSMDTRGFANAATDPMLVEDLIEEIRRTTKNYQPSIWLTSHMPHAMEQALSDRLGLPFRDCPLGDSMTLDNPNLLVSTVGTAMSSVVEFPFEFNLAAGVGKVGTPVGAAPPADVVDDGGGKGVMMLAGGAAAIALSLLVCAGLFLTNELYFKGQVASLQSTKDTEAASVGLLQTKEKELKEKVALDTRLIEMVTNARVRNYIYVALTNDLVTRKPPDIWVYSLSVDDRMEMLGKALSHQQVIDFARSFDQVPYVRSVLLDSMKESMLHGQRVFDFKIGGGIKMDPALIAPEPGEEGGSAPARPADASSKSGV